MMSTAVADSPKMRSVRCRRRACTGERGGLNIATSTASAATTVKAARWCRKAITADEYISTSGRLLTSLIPARPPAQSLGALHAGLALQAPLARGAGRRRGPAGLRWLERAADELREPLAGLAAVLFLGTMIARDDEQRPIGGDAPSAESAQPRLDVRVERRAAREIEAQLYRGRHLVDVLAAWPRRAHEGPGQLAVRNCQVRVDRQWHGGAMRAARAFSPRPGRGRVRRPRSRPGARSPPGYRAPAGRAAAPGYVRHGRGRSARWRG